MNMLDMIRATQLCVYDSNHTFKVPKRPRPTCLIKSAVNFCLVSSASLSREVPVMTILKFITPLLNGAATVCIQPARRPFIHYSFVV